MLEEHFEWERAKSLTDPRLELMTDEYGNLYSTRYTPDETVHTSDQGAFPRMVIPSEPEMAGPEIGPMAGVYVPDESVHGGAPATTEWVGPLAPEYYGFGEVTPWSEQPETAQPGPSDPEKWPPPEGQPDDEGNGFDWRDLVPDVLEDLPEKYKEGWADTFDAPFFTEGEFDIDPGEGKGLPGEGTLGGLPEIGAMTGMIGALLAMTIIPKLLDNRR